MVKLSVILPVYGVAQYIEKCTASLLSQTLVDIEFIFVDDHGPDNSIELVQNMIADSPRREQFVFLKPEHNLGAGMARNFAIPHAKGEYIAFVDSDDWIEGDMFERMYAEAKKYDSDLCCCQMQKVYPDGHRGDILKNPFIGNGEISDEKRSYFLTHYVSQFTSLIYRKSLIDQYNIRFPEERSADDSYFVSCVLMLAKSISYVDEPFYLYLIRPGSVCTTKDSTKYQKRLAVFNKLLAFSKQNGVYDNFKSEVDFMYIKKGYLSTVFNYVTNSTEPNKETIVSIYDELLKQIPDYKTNRFYRANFKLRALMAFIRAFPRLAVKFIKSYSKRKEYVV
ncbi:MAG: glycosyltransferase family 2 protein [Bacteroidales bacterium]|nr:glycosyltransferase family 2 protein [Bacteroidales bacterium]